MPAITFSGPLDAIEAGLASSGNDAVYFEAAAPNPKFDPEDYIEIRGKKKYWEKPTVNIAYLTIDLNGDAYSVGKAWTHESYRRQGIIRRLYDMAWDYARSKGKGFQAGWVQSPLMAKYWESLVDQGKAEAYTDEWTQYNTTGKGWRRIRASNLRPPCDPFEHGYAFIEPSGKVHLLNMSHPKWAEDYLYDHPELGAWYERIGGLLKHGWIRVANITNLSVFELNTPPKAAWDAVLNLMVDCVRKGMDPNVIIHVDHGAGDSNRTSKWRAGDFARKFGGQGYENALFDAAMSRVAAKKAPVSKHKLPSKTAAQRRRRNGDCYAAAGRYIMDNPDSHLQLVHGEVSGQGALEGTTFGHAWVLDGDQVIDQSNGRNLRLPKVIYYALGGIDRIDNLHVYSREQALDRMLKHKHFGPWELKTRSGL